VQVYFVLGDLVGDNTGQAGWGVWIGNGGTYDFFCGYKFWLCRSMRAEESWLKI
jgi:hypothetical protein